MILIEGDCLQILRGMGDESVQCCVTSPPYWGLRDYGVEGQLGLEKTPDEYVAKMVEVFREVRRVLKPDGTLWLNLGDSYAGSWGAQGKQGATGEMAGRSVIEARQVAAAVKRKNNTGTIPRDSGLKPKDLVGIPWSVAFALRADGWYLRSDIIWAKPNPMPESVTDRPTKSHEYIFLLAKSERYFYDQDATREPHGEKKAPGGFRPEKAVGPLARGGASQWERKRTTSESYSPNGRNRRTVWTVTTSPFKGAHFATFPPKLIRPCILAGSRPGDVVLDPFNGAGTTGLVALGLGRDYIGIELNPEYLEMTKKRLAEVPVELFKRGSA